MIVETAEQATQVCKDEVEGVKREYPGIVYRAPETMSPLAQVIIGIASGRFKLVDGDTDE